MNGHSIASNGRNSNFQAGGGRVMIVRLEPHSKVSTDNKEFRCMLYNQLLLYSYVSKGNLMFQGWVNGKVVLVKSFFPIGINEV